MIRGRTRGRALAGVVGLALLTPGTAELQAQAATDALEVLGAFDYDWSVRTAKGEEIALETFRGEVLVVNFWATWCVPCVAELESFERLEAELDGRDAQVRFLYVSPERPDLVEDFHRRHARNLDLVTEVRRAPPSLGDLVLPTTFVVNRAGEIVLRHRGASDWGLTAVADFLSALARSGQSGDGGSSREVGGLHPGVVHSPAHVQTLLW